MEPVYRLCFLERPGVMQIEHPIRSGLPGEVFNTKPRFGGGFASIGNFIIDMAYAFKSGLNYSLVEQNEFGSKDQETGEFTGCFGSLVRNESDFTLMVVDYPTKDYEKINPYLVLMEEPLTIVQGYNRTVHGDWSDILTSSFSAFDAHLWILILFACFTLTAIMLSQAFLNAFHKKYQSNVLEGCLKRQLCSEMFLENELKETQETSTDWPGITYYSHC